MYNIYIYTLYIQYIYIYISVFLCVCVCVCIYLCNLSICLQFLTVVVEDSDRNLLHYFDLCEVEYRGLVTLV